MTLFERTIPVMSYDIQYPEAYAKEMFPYNNHEAEHIISEISKDSGETICSRSLIMFLQQMTERIYELECEIAKLNRENKND